jgi:hypothetical protein
MGSAAHARWKATDEIAGAGSFQHFISPVNTPMPRGAKTCRRPSLPRSSSDVKSVGTLAVRTRSGKESRSAGTNIRKYESFR